MAGGYSVTFSVVDNATKQIDAINRRLTAMRAPVERLSKQVTRFVDVSGLRKVAQGFDWIGKAAGSVLHTLTAIVPVMGAITGAASIAGMLKLVSSYAAWSHELVAAADNIGITTQKLQQFEDATRLAGGNASDMRDGLKSLHTEISNIAIGQGNAGVASQMLTKLGVSIRDANGHIRTADDLMPELIKKIGAMKDPADRARFATELLGGQGDKLVETFRQSTLGFDAATNAAKRYKELTDDQKRSLQLFTEAQLRLGVQFDHLGQQISAMVARDLTPLLQKFSDFVDQNTPAILAAVDTMSRQFADWLAHVDWSKVEDGISKFVAALKWVGDNLDTVKTAAEIVAGVFAVKWASGIVGAVGAVANAFGVVGVGGAAGVGLLGALGLVVFLSVEIYRHWDEIKKGGQELAESTEKAFARVGKSLHDFWTGTVDPKDLPKPGEVPSYPTQHGTPGGAWAPSGAPQAAPGGAWSNLPADAGPMRPGGAQRSSSTGGFLPGGATLAAYHPGAVSDVAGGAGASTTEFWSSMAAAVAKGFEDAFDHITAMGGSGGGLGGAGGYQSASYSSAGGAPGQIGAPSSQDDGPVTPGAPHPSGRGADPAQLVAATAAALNIPHADAAAIVSNMQAESGLVSGINERHPVKPGSRGGFGLAQWTGPRRVALEAFAKRHGLDVSQQSTQLSFMKEELKQYPGLLKRVAAAKTPQEKAATWFRGYESGGDPGLEHDLPAHVANAARFAALPTPAAPPVTVPPPAPVNGSVDVSITHRNPPPNSAVTATGSGAVNVAPPRVEHQDMGISI